MKTQLLQRANAFRPTLALSGVVALTICLVLPARYLAASQAGKEYNEADTALNKAYQSLLASLHDPEQRAALVTAQKSWIKYRDEDVAYYALRFPESKGGLFYNTDLTRARTAALKTTLKSEE